MRTDRRVRHAAWIAALALLSSCDSSTGLSDAEIGECLAASRELGSIGGSGQIISLVATLLPDDAVAPSGSSAEEIQKTYDRAFDELYGIDVDDFMTLRQHADDDTVTRMGQPPRPGELVGDEWFVARDAVLLDAWNDEHPRSARAYCELIDSQLSGEP